ncbi:MAG: aldo/keto reductase [Phycisphaerales bacterium]|nr:MAG: aldo/keto reductase [Phycisphaerales bacterium]
MRYRPIPRTSLKLSEIGFGCWTMGGPNWSVSNGQPIGWADVKEDDILQGIKTGIDAGVNHWDNADIYGNGKAERLLAQSLHKLGIKRDTQILATKVGHFKGTAPYAYEPQHIRHQCEQSLKNLQTDHVDLYYFHHGTFTGPDYNNQTHDYLHEAADTMHALVKEGKVVAIGQSAYTDEDFERVVPVLRPHILQNKANLRYDDFLRPGSRLQSLMKTHVCAFVAFGPLDQGILLDKFDPANPPKFDEGDYRANRKDFNPNTLWAVREKLAKALAHFNKDKLTAEDRVRALASIAQRWLLAHDHVCSVIPGFRNARQAACNVAAANDTPMSTNDVAWLRDLFKPV